MHRGAVRALLHLWRYGVCSVPFAPWSLFVAPAYPKPDAALFVPGARSMLHSPCCGVSVPN